MPNDTFTWRGIDGTDVLTHFITTPAAAEEQGSWYYTYNGEMLPGSVKGIRNNYRNKDLTNTLLLAYGYGDGGAGRTAEPGLSADSPVGRTGILCHQQRTVGL